MKDSISKQEDRLYDVWLVQIEGVGGVKYKSIIKTFQSAKNFFNSSSSQISSFIKNEELASKIIESKSTFDFEKASHITKRDQISIVRYTDPIYPKLLLQLSDSPGVLFCIGDISILSQKRFISVVGSRKYSSYGEKACQRLVQDLVSNDFVIVSGMAFGIDSIAHRTSLEFGGKTVAVLASGIDIVSPQSNIKLYREIASKGLIISERPYGEVPHKGSFPRRNRIISGLSMGTIIVEGSEKSGSLITASFALEQCREVFAVPSPIFSKTGKGTNNLIKSSGAKLVSDVFDILDEFKLNEHYSEKKSKLESRILDDDEKEVFDLLNKKDLLYDELYEILDSKHRPKLSQTLGRWELEGVISKDLEGRYTLK